MSRHGSVHGLLLIDKLKTLSIFVNSLSATPISSSRIKRFTGLISISSNKINGPHGFTGPAQCGGGSRPILLMLLLLILIRRANASKCDQMRVTFYSPIAPAQCNSCNGFNSFNPVNASQPVTRLDSRHHGFAPPSIRLLPSPFCHLLCSACGGL